MSKKPRDFGMNSRVRSSGRVRQAVDTTPPPISRNVAQIAKLEEDQIQARGLSQRIAGAVTRAAGTSTFALAHLVWFASWIAINTGWVRRLRPFDPFPFNLLTMDEGADFVYSEGVGSAHVMAHPDEFKQAAFRYDLLRAAALSPEDSAGLIASLLEEL